MGNCNFKSNSGNDNCRNKNTEITPGQVKLLYPIGRGGFGKVWRAEHKRKKMLYAVKEMEKVRIISKRSVHSVLNERNILANIRHPFIVNMHYAYQTNEKLYLVMDLMIGGDLRYQMSRKKRFSEEQTCFFISCIILSLEYLHENSIIHRDIKPENLVLDEFGYLRLTDFGIARIMNPDNKNETSGTPGYMAPEIICRQHHTIVSDYFALGVMVFELMTGKRPYQGKNRKEIREAILGTQAQLKASDIPIN